MKKLEVHFGALSKPLAAQLRHFDIKTDDFQADADAITRLHLRGFIGDSRTHTARKRLMANIERRIRAESPENGAVCVPPSQPDGESIADASGFEGGKL